MSMMGSTGVDPMQALVAMRGSMNQQGPIGPNQGMGAPQLGAPPANNPQAQGNNLQTNGQVADVLSSMAQQASGGGDVDKLRHHLQQIQGMYPALLLAEHNNGHAELTGPAQEQFLAAAYARMHGAKTAHVKNQGRGQRLHLEWQQ